MHQKKMAQNNDEISELASILRSSGDKLLDASCKLSLSSTLIHTLNTSLAQLCKQNEVESNFEAAPFTTDSDSHKGVWDLQLLYDFIQKIVALKILPDVDNFIEPCVIDLQLFHGLKLLEINRFSLNLIKGLKYLRSHLEYITCIRCFSSLSELLEYCGADKCHGYVWSQLKKAVFSYNSLSFLDASLEFIPKLEVLDLSHNKLTDAHMINCLPYLSNLNLSYNNLQIVPPFGSSLCNSLRSLSLHSNFIEDISELSSLVNLHELDLSKNCLVNHSSLAPITCLPNLEWLNLLGNPLSFHPCHRILTVHYLHPRVTSRFILDHTPLNKAEQRIVNSLDFTESSINRSGSFSSQVTESTVINRKFDVTQGKDCINPADDSSSRSSKSISIASTSSNEMFNPQDTLIMNMNRNLIIEEQTMNTLVEDNVHVMQDSGFFAGTRPISPSQSSIGSANSLFSNESQELTTQYESDIEVLTNPSQSSIEVLDQISRDIQFSPS